MSKVKVDDEASQVSGDDARLDLEADREIDAGQFVSHQRVADWLQSWGKPDETCCPKPDPH